MKTKSPDEGFRSMSLDYNAPLDYLPRIKSYYLGLGYEKALSMGSAR